MIMNLKNKLVDWEKKYFHLAHEKTNDSLSLRTENTQLKRKIFGLENKESIPIVKKAKHEKEMPVIIHDTVHRELNYSDSISIFLVINKRVNPTKINIK